MGVPDSATIGLGVGVPDSATIGLGVGGPDSATIGLGVGGPDSATIGLGVGLAGSGDGEAERNLNWNGMLVILLRYKRQISVNCQLATLLTLYRAGCGRDLGNIEVVLAAVLALIAIGWVGFNVYGGEVCASTTDVDVATFFERSRLLGAQLVHREQLQNILDVSIQVQVGQRDIHANCANVFKNNGVADILDAVLVTGL